MFKNYLKTSWRNIVKEKGYSTFNILGLAVGMAVALIIGLWVQYHLSYDRFLPDFGQAYRAMVRSSPNGVTEAHGATCLPLGEAIRRDVPEVKYVVQADWGGQHSLMTRDQKVYSQGLFAGDDFLNIFRYPLLEGNVAEVLKQPASIVLTRATAIALFGQTDPMNKTVRLDNLHDVKVTGVLADLPGNSSLTFNYIIPFSYYIQTQDWIRQNLSNWNMDPIQTFIALKPNVSKDQAESALKTIYKRYDHDGYQAEKLEAFLHPLKDWHLYSDFKNGAVSGGFIDYVRMFSIIGMLVLLIACINFTNLSIARSERRAREVGVRKALGSLKRHIVFQFLMESVLITLMAFVVALMLLSISLPAFNTLTTSTIQVPWSSAPFWGVMLSYVLLTGLLAGSRPAFYLSSFRPVKVLKGGFKAGRFAALPRQVLVVLQFMVSVGLIIGTIVVFKQIQFAKDRPVGYSREGLVITYMSTTGLHDHFDALRTDLLKSGAVTEIAESNNPAWNASNNTGDVSWQGMDPSLNVDFADIKVTSGYGKTIGWQFVQGRDFSPRLLTDSNGVILNETAVKYMGLKNPVGETIRLLDSVRTVIGVVKDMVVGSPFEPVKQTIYYLGRPKIFLNIRINPKVGAQQAVDVLKAVCKTYAPGVPFGFRFMDNVYAGKFENEERVGELAGFFTILAVFISCLGLFGMASYMAEQRVKEIGVRKVLGASVFNLWRLLSKDFVGLVLLSLLLAFPLAGYFMHSWLQQYTYRTGLGWWVFAAAGIGALLITLLTVSYQSIRAALANPVKSLRSE